MRTKNKGLVAAAVAAALGAAGCGGAHQAAGRASSSTTAPPASSTTAARGTAAASTAPAGRTTTTRTAGRRATSSTSSAATTSTATGPAVTGTAAGGRGALVQPAGGPVPSGFSPVSFTAISPREYWLLGQAPCHGPVCTSIVRTLDGGAHFVGLPAPVVPLATAGPAPGAAGTGINTLRFADALDGYAFDSSPSGELWVTHDGGEHWAEAPFLSGKSLLGFGSAGGFAFALAGTCSNGSCSGVSVYRAPVSSDSWAALPVPVPDGTEQVASMTVHGANLWISLTTSAAQPDQVLVVGSASGAKFTTVASPCSSGLGGTIQASSDLVLWAVCPTGMLSQAWRSTDGGAHWSTMATGELVNSALLAAASDTTAVLEPGSQPQLLRTTDGGATWAPVTSLASSGPSWTWIGFTSSTTGSALREPTGASGAQQLWRTADGGLTWTGPVAIG